MKKSLFMATLYTVGLIATIILIIQWSNGTFEFNDNFKFYSWIVMIAFFGQNALTQSVVFLRHLAREKYNEHL